MKSVLFLCLFFGGLLALVAGWDKEGQQSASSLVAEDTLAEVGLQIMKYSVYAMKLSYMKGPVSVSTVCIYP